MYVYIYIYIYVYTHIYTYDHIRVQIQIIHAYKKTPFRYGRFSYESFAYQDALRQSVMLGFPLTSDVHPFKVRCSPESKPTKLGS